MKVVAVYRSLFLIAIFTGILSSCSVGNKDIPDPGGNTGVDTSNTALNSFQIIVSGDTSFVMNIYTADSLNSITDDSLIIGGIEFSGNSVIGLMGFRTFMSAPGTYLTEESPPGIRTAEFGILKTIRGLRRILDMNHGTITITEHNTSERTVKGRFDVNNEFNVSANIYIRCRGSFYVRYQ